MLLIFVSMVLNISCNSFCSSDLAYPEFGNHPDKVRLSVFFSHPSEVICREMICLKSDNLRLANKCPQALANLPKTRWTRHSIFGLVKTPAACKRAGTPACKGTCGVHAKRYFVLFGKLLAKL